MNLEKAIMSILICKRAWDKYGEKSFSFYVVEEVAKSELKSSEIFWIEKLDTFNSGYNLTAGGEGQYGRHLTDAQKKHLSEINTGAKNPNYGLKRSAETKKKMSDAMKKPHGKMSEKHRMAISKGNKGKKRPWFNKPVVHIETGEVFCNISKAAEKTGFSISGISGVCRGKRKKIFNQHFEFMEVESI